MSGLPVISFNGLNADSLGTYLASLGLFSLVARKWTSVRACWLESRFCLVGGPATMRDVVDFVGDVGAERRWSRYQKCWDEHKGADVTAKTSIHTAQWRSLEADEELLPLFGAHLSLDERVRMNPLLGSGGNAGQRKFDRGWNKAVKVIEKPPRGQSRTSINGDLDGFLQGMACVYLSDFSAGSWFGAANKIYNHGTKKPYREGEVTPWAMALACEGLPFFAGGASRQLGSRRQPKGAFPFVTVAMAPKSLNEAGTVEAEIWAPIWSRPMTKPELTSLFMRGRSEIGRRGATTSAEFSVAILRRGVDGGIVEFRRFLLLHTTSSQTFESQLSNIVVTPKEANDIGAIQATRTAIELRNRLPADRKVGRRWRFNGLRGPIEQALVDLSASGLGAAYVEKAWALVDKMFDTLIEVGRNRRFRDRNVRFRLLPGEWAASLFDESTLDREARLALALSSLARTSTCAQFVAYRIGIQRVGVGELWEFPEHLAGRRVWSDVELPTNLCSLSERRAMEASQAKAAMSPPFDATSWVRLNDIHAWLSEEVDADRMSLWLNRLCLFDWSTAKGRIAARSLQARFQEPRQRVVDGGLALYGLFRPLVNGRLCRLVNNENVISGANAASCVHIGRIIALLRRGDLDAAIDAARVAYHFAGVTLADFDTPMAGPDTEQLLAALVIPSETREIRSIFRRWQVPDRHLDPI